MRSLIDRLYQRSPTLTGCAGVHLAMLAIVVVLALLDERTVMGVNPWFKPMKFLLSTLIYLPTLTWMLSSARATLWAERLIVWGVATIMLVENLCICLQAGRGVRSHFNDDTVFDSVVFGVMGTLIALHTVLIALFLHMQWRRPADWQPVHLWGVRLGLLVFLGGSVVGGLIGGRGGVAVGVEDGGPGLTFLNWSTQGGDLRIAHAMGLHGLQAVPLFAMLVASRLPRGRVAAVAGFALVYAMALLWILDQALRGQPLVH